MKEYSQSPRAGTAEFDPNYLRLLPDDRLSEVLFTEAFDTLSLLEGDRREALEDDLLALSWVQTEESPEGPDEESATFGEYSEAWAAARSMLRRHAAGHALAEITNHKDRIDSGLAIGRDDDGMEWTEDYTLHGLKKICHAQETAGIDYAGDYVRQTALTALTRADSRASVLLLNALGGDQASLEMGFDFLKEALTDKEAIDARTMVDCLDCLALLMAGNYLPDNRWQVARDLSVDALAATRRWRLYGYNTEKYATAAVILAVLCRDRQAL